MTDYKCKYCHYTFACKRNYERHQKRVTACISFKEMIKKFEYYDTLIVGFQNKIDKITEDFNKTIFLQKEKISELSGKLLLEESDKWKEISIIAPFLSSRVKKHIKSDILKASNELEIRNYFKTNHAQLQIAKLTLWKDKVEVILEMLKRQNARFVL